MRDHRIAVFRALAGFERRLGRRDLSGGSRAGRRRSRPQPSVPHEHVEQVNLCKWLLDVGVSYFAVPNGSHLANGYRSMSWLKAEGLKEGIPDLILVDLAPIDGKPVAIEMKRVGGKGGKVRKDRTLTDKGQAYWQCLMPSKGWHHIVGLGSDDAVEQLVRLGYG